MSLYVAAPRSRRVLAAYERTPVIQFSETAAFRSRTPADNADATVVLLPGERLLQGSDAALRHSLRQPGKLLQIPVHYAGLPQLSLDLIAIEPRAFTRPPQREEILSNFRIASSGDNWQTMFYALRDNTAPWAALSLALVESSRDLPSAMDRLRVLWTRENTPPVMRSLVLRNLIVMLIQHGDYDKARELLTLGMDGYPEYAELRYLSSLLWLVRQKFTLALQEAERASAIQAKSQWVGSGGESTYRADWIKGACAVIAGRQEMAVQYLMSGIVARPAFRPAVESLLDTRLPPALVERLSLELCHLIRREPDHLNSVFEYLILCRCFVAARRLTETLPLCAETREMLTARLEAAESSFRDDAEVNDRSVLIQAPFFQNSSLARIGRELALGLMADEGLDVCLEPSAPATLAERDIPKGELLSQAMLCHPRKLGLTIRTSWPPAFRRPPAGKLAVIFPWEYSGLPQHWIAQMNANCDQVWAPSKFVANVLVRAGMDRDRIRVIPNGVDPEVFTPDGPDAGSPEVKGFVFLFVGGAITRKGFDLLLDAYAEAFTSADDVTLVVKESGSTSFYRNNSLLGALRRFAPGSRSPRVVLNTDPMDDLTLAALYRRANCLVHPYRGEGFGMTLAEAMACGTPVITTAAGPAPEFCDESTGWMIRATETLVPDDPPPAGAMTEPLTWFEPSFEDLIQAMRAAYEDRAETARRGSTAARRIYATHSWTRIMEMYTAAARDLCGLPTDAGVLV